MSGLKALAIKQRLGSCILDIGLSTSIEGYMKALKTSLCSAQIPVGGGKG